MWEEDSWGDFDDCGFIYDGFYLMNAGTRNYNRLQWLYDDE